MSDSRIFPGGRRAAVSLTYDDGIAEQLDHAIPDLEESGLRGTFYIPTLQHPGSWHDRLPEWRGLVGADTKSAITPSIIRAAPTNTNG